jgi:hypothetical protein
VIIYAYNHHVRLLSPEPLVVKQPKFTRVEEPTLLCNHVRAGTYLGGFGVNQDCAMRGWVRESRV